MTLALPPDTVQFYNDGPDFPKTPLQMEAERAYRAGFLCSASTTARWRSPDEALIESLRRSRKDVRRRAEVLVPSSVLYGNPDMDSDQIVYRAGHDATAANARGKHQAVEIACQCWEAMEDEGYPTEQLGPLVMHPWLAEVRKWAQETIDPNRLIPPPRPEECIPEANRLRLDQLRTALDEESQLILPTSARSVRQLMNENPDLREPLVQGLLRIGETMNVIASPKMGKSWLVTDLALAVASGRKWLDIFETVRGNVLIIDNELHRETSANRIPKVMKARGIPMEEVGDKLFVENVRGKLQDIYGLNDYFDGLTPGKFKLIILDAFYRFMPRDTDENDNGSMSHVYNQLDEYAAKLGCSFALVHHSAKGNQSGKSVTDVGAGAGSQSRATDTHLILRPHEETDCVVLDAVVRSWPPIQPRVLRWTFPVWTLDDSLDPAALRVDRPRRKAKTTSESDSPPKATEPAWDALRFVAEFVTETPVPKVTLIESAAARGLSERRTQKLLKQAEGTGLVHRWKYGSNQPVRFARIPQTEVAS